MGIELIQTIEEKLGKAIRSMPRVSGIVETEDGARFYLKRGPASRIYACEATGLEEIAETGTVNTPEVILSGEDFILTRYIESGSPGPGFYTALGRMVAAMHRTAAPAFGFREDNFIGTTPQPNIPDREEATDWAEFYYNKRLSFQLGLAVRKGWFAEEPPLREATFNLLSGVEEPPSLLHGDLWGGNYLCGADGAPYLIDPAVWYGHRETDIAMTMLFGGFPPEFYRAYDGAYPLQDGWRDRIPVYQLYHVLNHLNMFGGGYLGQARSIITSLRG